MRANSFLGWILFKGEWRWFFCLFLNIFYFFFFFCHAMRHWTEPGPWQPEHWVLATGPQGIPWIWFLKEEMDEKIKTLQFLFPFLTMGPSSCQTITYRTPWKSKVWYIPFIFEWHVVGVWSRKKISNLTQRLVTLKDQKIFLDYHYCRISWWCSEGRE